MRTFICVFIGIILFFHISNYIEAHNRFYTLRYIKRDGTFVTESFRSFGKCLDQQMYLEMVEKQSIIKTRCR